MHRENIGLINYGQRGRRGYAGTVAVNEVFLVDSEGDVKVENVGSKHDALLDFYLLKGVPGEPGRDGDIADVIVNGQSVVSEGVAYIEIGNTLEAGDNIIISEGVISAVDTVYYAGNNITISEGNIINAADVDLSIGKELTVTEDVGGYIKGDVIPADTPMKDIIEKILSPEPRPEPPTENLNYWGVTGSRTSGAPTGIDSTFAAEVIDPSISQRDGIIKYYTTVKQYACFAYPASMPDLVHIVQSDMFDVIGSWTKITCSYNGQDYKMYYSSLTQQTNSKYEFKWR